MNVAPSVGSRLALQPVAFGVILTVLALAVVVGTGQGPLARSAVSAELVLLVVAVAGGVGLLLARLEFGILLLAVVAIAVPAAVGTGTQSSIPASLILAGVVCALWIARTLISGHLVVARSPVILPALGFMVAVVLSTVYSNAVRPPLVIPWATFSQVQLGGLSLFVVSAALILVVMHTVRDVSWLEWLTWIFLALGAVCIVGFWLQGRRDLAGFDSGGLFSLWVVALALGQVLFNNRLPIWARVGLLLLAAAWMQRRYFIEVSWLSGWVPITAAVLALAFLRSKKLFLVALVVAGTVWAVNEVDLYEREVTGQAAQGNFLRFEIWRQSLELTREHLALGVGPAGYAPYYMTYFPDLAMSTHSNYLDIFSQTGLVGTFCFLWLLLALGQVGLKARTQWSSGFGAGFANGALAGFTGLVVAMALGDWVIPFVYNATIGAFRHTVHSWIFLGALAGMQRMRA